MLVNKPKILLLSDDVRMHSGIATQSREFVFGTLDKFEWVQIGGAINHPDAGKIIDMNEAVRSETEIKDYWGITEPKTNIASEYWNNVVNTFKEPVN